MFFVHSVITSTLISDCGFGTAVSGGNPRIPMMDMMDRGIHAPVLFPAHPCARLTPRALVQDKEILIWLKGGEKEFAT